MKNLSYERKFSWLSDSYTLFKTFDTQFIYKERFAWNPAKNRMMNFIFRIIFITFPLFLFSPEQQSTTYRIEAFNVSWNNRDLRG